MLCTSRALLFDKDTAALQCLDGKNNNAASQRSQRQTAAGVQRLGPPVKQRKLEAAQVARQAKQTDQTSHVSLLPSLVARLEMAAHHCSNALGNIDLPFPPLGLRREGAKWSNRQKDRGAGSCLSGLGEELTLYSSNGKQPSLKPAKFQTKMVLAMHVHV